MRRDLIVDVYLSQLAATRSEVFVTTKGLRALFAMYGVENDG
jgi:hypothetical protein